MKTTPQALLDLIPNPKTINARVTFRVMRPQFTVNSIPGGSIVLDNTLIDTCAYGTGILRVANYNDYLYTQNVTDLYTTWPDWVNTGIALEPGSRPGVDDGYVWYQKTGAPYRLYYRDFGDWSTEVLGRDDGEGVPEFLAPISNKRCYSLKRNSSDTAFIMSGCSDGYWLENSKYALYEVSNWNLDAVPFSDDGNTIVDYIYFEDKDTGRVSEARVNIGGEGMAIWGKFEPVIAIDAIDENQGFHLHGAELIDGKVVLSGRITRSSDTDPISMDVYMFGPEDFTLGRDMFISQIDVGGKIVVVGDELVVCGATYWAVAGGTNLFGVDNAANKLVTSDIEYVQLQEAENRSSVVTMSLSTELDRTVIQRGSQVDLEVAYNDNWMTVMTCEIDRVASTNGGGKSLVVYATNLTAKRLGQWSPDQGIYIPSQAFSRSDASDLSAVIRADGRFGEDDSTLAPAQFNKLSVLYTAARASRGGIMRAKFWNEATNDITTRNPRFGVGLNYYRESKVEATARLGVEYSDVDDSDCGHNGVVAIYSRNEAGGYPGVAVYRWENSELTLLYSTVVTLPTGAYVWLQIRMIDGYIHVSWKTDGATVWTAVLSVMHDGTALWTQEDGGRGCVVMEKQLMMSLEHYGFASDDTTIAVEPHSSFPTIATVLVDDELIIYNAKSAYNSAYPNPSYPGTQPSIMPHQWVLGDSSFSGKFLPLYSNLWGVSNGSFVGAAATLYGLNGAVYTKTARITAFDNGQSSPWPQSWNPNTGFYSPGWPNDVGNTSAGSWVWNSSLQGLYTDVDMKYSLPGYVDGEGFPSTPDVKLFIKPALYVSARGVNGTTAVAHHEGTLYRHVNIQLHVDTVEFYSEEEDIMLADALRHVIRLAGGDVTENNLIDVDQPIGSDWTIVDIDDGKKDFIAEIEIPSNILGVGPSPVRLGWLFYGSDLFSTSVGTGFFVCAENYYLSLYTIDAGTLTLVDRFAPGMSSMRSGTLRVSVQDNRFSMWLNSRLMYTFYDEEFSDEAYLFKAFAVHNAQAVAVPDVHFQYSVLNDLMADIVVGVRGKGMSILSEMTSNRSVYFRCEPDGSLYFYKALEDIGTIPDIVISESREEADDALSRVRMEGISITESVDWEAIAEHGNLFETANSMYANTTQDLLGESDHYFELRRQRSDVRNLEVVFHPALQPGDGGTIAIDGENVDVGVMATTVMFGFRGENFGVDASLEVYAQ